MKNNFGVQITFVTVVVALIGCSHFPSHGRKVAGQETGPSKFCDRQSAGKTPDGDNVILCSKVFSERPFVRPPEDLVNADKTVEKYVVLEAGNESRFPMLRDRLGNTFEARDHLGQPLTAQTPLVLKNFLPTTRSLFLIYRVVGTPEGNTLKIHSLEPAVWLTDGALDSIFLGPWEGTASLRIPGGKEHWQFGKNAETARFRISFHQLQAQEKPLSDGTTSDGKRRFLDPRWKLSRAVAQPVENLSRSVRSSSGECLPALRSYGEKDPLKNSNGEGMLLYREFEMHRPDSHFELVLKYPEGLFSPQTTAMDVSGNTRAYGMFHFLRLSEPSAEETSLLQLIHGSPLRAIRIQMRPVKGGGGPCLEK